MSSSANMIKVFLSRFTGGFRCSLFICCRQTTQPGIRRLESPLVMASQVKGAVAHSPATAQPPAVAVAPWLTSHGVRSYGAKPRGVCGALSHFSASDLQRRMIILI